MKVSKSSYVLIAAVVLVAAGVVYQMGGIGGLEGSFGAKPDLTITDISVDSSNILNVTQANIGGASVAKTTEGITQIYVDDMTKAAYSYKWTALSDQKFLLSKNKAVMQPATLTAGSHVVKACIDSSKLVIESNEVNNCATVRTGGDSDLSVAFVDSADGYTLESTLTNGENTVGILAVMNDGTERADLEDLAFQYKGLDDKSELDAVVLERIGGSTQIPGTMYGSDQDYFKFTKLDYTDFQIEPEETAYFKISAYVYLAPESSSSEYFQLSMEDLQDLDPTYNKEDGNVKWLVGTTEETAIMMGKTKRIEATKISR